MSPTTPTTVRSWNPTEAAPERFSPGKCRRTNVADDRDERSVVRIRLADVPAQPDRCAGSRRSRVQKRRLAAFAFVIPRAVPRASPPDPPRMSMGEADVGGASDPGRSRTSEHAPVEPHPPRRGLVSGQWQRRVEVRRIRRGIRDRRSADARPRAGAGPTRSGAPRTRSPRRRRGGASRSVRRSIGPHRLAGRRCSLHCARSAGDAEADAVRAVSNDANPSIRRSTPGLPRWAERYRNGRGNGHRGHAPAGSRDVRGRGDLVR